MQLQQRTFLLRDLRQTRRYVSTPSLSSCSHPLRWASVSCSSKDPCVLNLTLASHSWLASATACARASSSASASTFCSCPCVDYISTSSTRRDTTLSLWRRSRQSRLKRSSYLNSTHRSSESIARKNLMCHYNCQRPQRPHTRRPLRLHRDRLLLCPFPTSQAICANGARHRSGSTRLGTVMLY